MTPPIFLSKTWPPEKGGRNLSLITSPSDDVDSLTRQYNEDLTNLLDKHAPVITRKITLRPNAPWYDDSLREMKRGKRSCERKWNKTKLHSDKLVVREKTLAYTKLSISQKQLTTRMQLLSATKDSFSALLTLWLYRKLPNHCCLMILMKILLRNFVFSLIQK